MTFMLTLIVGGFLLVQVVGLIMLADAKMMAWHERLHARRYREYYAEQAKRFHQGPTN